MKISSFYYRDSTGHTIGVPRCGQSLHHTNSVGHHTTPHHHTTLLTCLVHPARFSQLAVACLKALSANLLHIFLLLFFMWCPLLLDIIDQLALRPASFVGHIFFCPPPGCNHTKIINGISRSCKEGLQFDSHPVHQICLTYQGLVRVVVDYLVHHF